MSIKGEQILRSTHLNTTAVMKKETAYLDLLLTVVLYELLTVSPHNHHHGHLLLELEQTLTNHTEGVLSRPLILQGALSESER